jgi:hypothetical protein
MAEVKVQDQIEQAWHEKCHAQFEERHEKCVYLSTRELQLLQKRGVNIPIYWINKDETLAYIKVDFDQLIQLAK